MRWSWRIGSLAGTELRVHITFVILLIWVMGSYWILGKTTAAMLSGLTFILALFACVLLHEFGHALAARGYGIATRYIILLPIGGLARLERFPDKPRQELWVALAGPLVNVFIAAGLFLWLSVFDIWLPLNQLRVPTGPFLERLLVANLWLVLFNLIPAFPMDGGRVLRALLASRMGYVKATRIAAIVGQSLAVIFVVIGIFGNPILVFIGLFVWIGAAQEAGATELKGAVSGTPVRAAMLTEFHRLQCNDTLAAAIRLTLHGSQQDFPVIEKGSVIGILTRADLLAGLTQHGSDYPVRAVMHRAFLTAEHGDMLDSVIERLRNCECHTVPVVRDGWLIGLLTPENLSDYLLIHTALRDRSDAKPGAGKARAAVVGTRP
jgi:Zn-dependent protease/predicted transcriptional regulator